MKFALLFLALALCLNNAWEVKGQDSTGSMSTENDDSPSLFDRIRARADQRRRELEQRRIDLQDRRRDLDERIGDLQERITERQLETSNLIELRRRELEERRL